MLPSEIVSTIEGILDSHKIKKADFYKKADLSSAVMSTWRSDRNYPSMDALARINAVLGTSFGITLLDEKKPVPTDEDGLGEIIDIFSELDASRRSKLIELARLYLDDQRRSEGTR